MKQVIRKGLREIIVDEVPDPVVTPHHIIVRPVYSLISSGTESASIHQESVVKEVAENPSHLQKVWQALKGNGPVATFREVKAKFSEYAVLGYSGAGILVDKHAGVTDLEIGERVAYGGEGTGHGEHIGVGRNLAARVPDAVPFERACFTTLGAIAMNAVRTAEINIGDQVTVLGLGLVGQLIAQLVRCQGGRVIAVDLSPARVDLAGRLGAENTALAGDGGAAEVVRSVTNGRGADCVIVAASSKSAAPARQALEICRDRGRIVVVGAVELSFPWSEMYAKEIQLLMARAYGPGSYDETYEKRGHDYPLAYVRWTENRNMEEFLRLLADGSVQVGSLITHEFALEDAPKAYQTVLDPSSGSLAVVLRYPEPASGAEVYRPKTRVEISVPAPDGARLRVGAIGAGNLARWVHLPNVKKIDGCELRAVCSQNGARAKSYGIRFGARYCCSDYQEMLEDRDIDVILIASRNQHHASQALAALAAGKHVFVEKPMALTEAECRELAAAVVKTGRLLTVGFNRRFAPIYLRLKEALRRRAGPAMLNVRVSSPGISGNYWMADPEIGGAILGEACHFIDLMYWLLESEPVSVTAYSLPAGQKDPAGQNNICSSFHFADGSIANLTYTTTGSRKFTSERVEAFAPGISAVAEDFKRFTLHASMSRRSPAPWFPDKGYRQQLEGFFRNLREGKSEVTVRDGARATIGCLRMLQSAQTLAPMPVDWQSVVA
jgi:predicted dehydrogenase/threonine dehydrogenase-like Zn-dependent dehydrogenase